MTKDEVKKLLNWKTDKYDDYLDTIIPILIEYAADTCNKEFDPQNLPGGVKLFVAKACEYNITSKIGLEARTLGDASYNYETEVPAPLHRYLKPYREIRLP